MRSGSVSDQPTIELLCSLAAQKASGRLDIADGAKKRSFWFEGGALTQTRSNLKSESLERLRERDAAASDDELLAQQGKLRVRNAMALTEGEWSFTPNDPPPSRFPVDLPRVAREAIDEGLVHDALLKARLASHMVRFPRLVSAGVPPESLPFSGPERQLLDDLDGLRPLRDVLDFAPIPADQALRVIYLALCCGAVSIEDSSSGARVQASPSERIDALFDEPKVEIGPDPDLRRLREERERIRAAENDFQVLGISWDASDADYRKAYFRMAQDFHPDRWTARSPEHAELAGDIFARLGAAWAALGDPAKRQETIDRVIHGKKTEDELAEEKVRDILAAENSFKAGLSEFRSGRIVQAHEQFKAAAQRVPEEMEYLAYYGYTTFRLAHGKDDVTANEGVNMVRTATEQGAKLANGWALMGMIYHQQEQVDLAKKALLMALKLEPSNAMAQNELKRIKRALEKLEEEQKAASGIGGFFSRLFGKK